jgi:hypothetical protein
MAFFRSKPKVRTPSEAIAAMRAGAADSDWRPVYNARLSLAELRSEDVSPAEWFWFNALGAISAQTLGQQIPAEWTEWRTLGAAAPVPVIAYRAALKMMTD